VRTDPDGDIEDDDDDDDAEDEVDDEVFGTPLLPRAPPSTACPAAKKFRSAATVAAAAGGKKKKKKSPSIIKTYSSDWSELGATMMAAAKKSHSLAMNHHRLCTPPIQCLVSRAASAVCVVHTSERCSIAAMHSAIFAQRRRTCYTDEREDVFRIARHTRKESLISTRKISSTCRACRTSTTCIAIC